MKILIITPRVPYPPFRGDKLKIFNMTEFLRKGNEVKIISFRRGSRDAEYIEEMKSKGINIETVNMSLVKSVINLIPALFTKIPFQVAFYSSVAMEKKILEENNNYDIIYFHLIRTARYREIIKTTKTKCIIDFTDAISLYLKRYSEVLKNPFKKLMVGIEKKRIEQYEPVANKFERVYVCSEVDKKHLENKGVKNIRILNNGVDLKTFSAGNVEEENHRIIFTGNMPYFPNYDAVEYFVKDIFPMILKEIPETKFYAVGQKPPAVVRSLASSNVIVTGFVEDIRTEYLKSSVNIAPIRFGAGTLNKIIESMVLGIPVVASALSVAGMPEELKKYIYIASGEKEFADKVIYVLKNNQECRLKAKEAVPDIKKLLDWEVILANFENELKELIK